MRHLPHLGGESGFHNPFLLEILCPISDHVHCSCSEDEMLNYKEHPSKSSHSRPDKNLIDFTIGTNNPDWRSDHVYSFLRILPKTLSITNFRAYYALLYVQPA
ncbi:hypothetical protein M9H77_14336 [Catharanthus roseus]|uniref:Uncharacterized protein n=1 Tax=Catharanthus roseus TaxID=4058 RepID=A0ACC0BMR1_CATRO|nr:hypothetical protein M9H77_14336 [Catharanthus roseus]